MNFIKPLISTTVLTFILYYLCRYFSSIFQDNCRLLRLTFLKFTRRKKIQFFDELLCPILGLDLLIKLSDR